MMTDTDQWFVQGQHDGLCGFYAALNAIWDFVAHSYVVDQSEDESELDYGLFGRDGRRRKFFDECVECLGRIGGINILKSHPAVGGLDVFRLEEFVGLVARTQQLPLTAKRFAFQDECEMSFNKALASLESKIGETYDDFALICGAEAGGHWVTILRKSKGGFKLIDPGDGQEQELSHRNEPDHTSGLLLSYNCR